MIYASYVEKTYKKSEINVAHTKTQTRMSYKEIHPQGMKQSLQNVKE